MGIGSAHAAWRHASPSRAARWVRGLVHAAWEYVRMRMTHVVWNHMGMCMAHVVCGMRDAWGGAIAGGVVVGRIVAMVHCRNGVLTKCHIALPCRAALPHRGVVAALAGVSAH